ncbi:MAG: hypothetical protein AABZ76_07540 [Pseudomonadota bacterium]|jgi:hypothetical protein|uniref:hypothetical protein n=1 Tax=Sphingobium yanoikuyae TaxID=13690 RepID=UPI003113BC5A
MGRFKNFLRHLIDGDRDKTLILEVLAIAIFLLAAAVVGRTEVGKRLAIGFTIAGATID